MNTYAEGPGEAPVAAEPPRPYAVPPPPQPPLPVPPPPSRPRRPRFWAVHLLIGLNVAYFLAMVIRGVDMIHPSTVDLLRWGADLGLLTLSGQWWRVLTAMFVHVGAVHLLMNMLSLWIIGRWVELWLGGRWMLFVYMVTGLFAGLASSRWQYDVPSAGASGAVLGLFGVFWGMVLRGRLGLPAAVTSGLNRWAWSIVLLNGIFGAAVPNLNHLVHGVGLGTGLAFGLIVAEPWRATTARRVTRRMLATTAVLVGLAAGVVATAPDASIRLREQDEENLNALRGLGLVQQILQQKSRIIEYYEQQAEASPGDFEAWMTLGEVLLELGEIDRTREVCDQILGSPAFQMDDGQRMRLLNTYGIVTLERGDLDEAEALFREAAAMTEDLRLQVMTLENIGLVYLWRGDWEAALHHAEAVQSLDVEWVGWNAAVAAIACARLGRTDEAARWHTRWRADTDLLQTQLLARLLPVELRPYLLDAAGRWGLPSDGEQQ